MGKCECEQWVREGYCKHGEMVARYEEYLESVEYRAEAYDEAEEGRLLHGGVPERSLRRRSRGLELETTGGGERSYQAPPLTPLTTQGEPNQ